MLVARKLNLHGIFSKTISSSIAQKYVTLHNIAIYNVLKLNSFICMN